MALPKERKIETMSVSESRKQYSELLNRVYRDEERVIIEKNGIPVAAIVPVDDVDTAEIEGLRNQGLRDAMEATRRAFDDVPADEIERRIAQSISEVDEARRKRRAGTSDAR